MKTIRVTQCLLLFFFFPVSLPAVSQSAEVRVSVAASMIEAVRELAAAYRLEHAEVSIIPNSGSSGFLARQIVQGAPADLFISANTRWMDYLVQAGKVSRRTLQVVASNSLVFAGPAKAGISSLDAVSSLPRIAIGSPQSVPAGQYAEQALRAAGLYEDMSARHRMVMAKDVRQALLYADRGEVDGAFVYRTDALLAERVVILFTVPAHMHDRIDYPAGLTLTGERNEAARAFHTFLASREALPILEKFGFSAPSAAGTL